METNIVEVENFVQQSEERRGRACTQEGKTPLGRYPKKPHFGVFITEFKG